VRLRNPYSFQLPDEPALVLLVSPCTEDHTFLPENSGVSASRN
jgi:hypothetical protein